MPMLQPTSSLLQPIAMIHNYLHLMPPVYDEITDKGIQIIR